MKKILILALFVLVLSAVASPAFALICKNGNYGSDECWTTGQTTTNDGAIVAGTVMVYDFKSSVIDGNSADNASFYVRKATSTDQGVYVAGVAQKSYASGDRVELLVRGRGKLRVADAMTSGDRLYVYGGSTEGTYGRAIKSRLLSATDANVATTDKAIAFALTTTTAASTTDAYIVIV